MKEWQVKMLDGMRLIQEACRENDEWHECNNCPFDEYCEAAMEMDVLEDPWDGMTKIYDEAQIPD